MKSWEDVEADEDRILSVHFTQGRGGHAIDKIVIHHNGGDLSIEGCYSVWQSREASAHYQVESSGRIGQLVWDTDTAWHCGDFEQNQRSIGIEHADDSSNPWHISDAAIDNGAHLVAALCRFYGLGRPEWGKNLFGHSDFAQTKCPASLAVGGSQHDEYVARAQHWYDAMTGAGTAPEEEEMQASDVWTYNWQDTAPGGNMYNCATQTHGMLQQLTSAYDGPEGDGTSGTLLDRIGYIDMRVRQDHETIQEMAKKLDQLAMGGLDADSVAKGVADAVAARLEAMRIKVGDGSAAE